MSRTRVVAMAAGLLVMLAGIIGHFWHKYFTATGAARATDLQHYVSNHWYFWMAVALGLLLVCIGAGGKPGDKKS